MKSQRGITLIIVLMIIVIMILIISVVTNLSNENLAFKDVNDLYADIKTLNDHISVYYNKYGNLPLVRKFHGSTDFYEVKNSQDDTNEYYVIDISKLNNLLLTRKLSWTFDDVYIINTVTHTIYYPKGIEYNGETYYSMPITEGGIATPRVDENGLAIANTTITTSIPNVQIVIPAGFAPVILKGSNSTTSMPGQDGSVKEIMPASKWNSITADQINKGIVVVDHAITYTNGVPDFNEYVWVPIPNSTDFARVAWTTRYGVNINGTRLDYGEIGTTQILANNSTENAFWENTSVIEYINMVSSVNSNKGFYISRYEASQGANNVVQSKRGQTAWVNILQTDAITASINNAITNTHLIYGIEWDSILKWLQTTETRTLAEMQTNSNTWGNYYTSVSPANNFPWVINTKQNTGTSEYWKANNIYDLAGNVYEWTQEKYSINNMSVQRGGCYFNQANQRPAAFRLDVIIEDNKTENAGFRYSFYI